MAGKRCIKCGKEQSVASFIGTRSPLLGGAMPICRTCVKEMINAAEPTERWNVVDKLCQLADIPFVPETFEQIYAAHKAEAFGNYAAMFREKPYNTLDWTEYNAAYLQLAEEKRVEDGLPQLREKKTRELVLRWGANYDDQQIVYLENLYQGILQTSGIVGTMNDDQVKKLCKVSLIIEEKIRAGEDFDKDLKSYDIIAKQAGITTESIREGNEFNSTGEIFAYLEKLGFKAKYYDGAIKDEVDKSMKVIQYWMRYLYINETGVADEIAERIENLKIADKITNSGFDWGEYDSFAEDQDDQEEFDVDI